MPQIIIPMLALYFIYFLVCRKIYAHIRKKTKDMEDQDGDIIGMLIRGGTIALMVLLAFTDNIVGNGVYYYLVKTKGGAHIYKPIEKVDGFLLKTTFGGFGEIYTDLLLSNKLKYIEEDVTKANPLADPVIRKFTTEKGFYKMYIAEVGDKNCKTNMKDAGTFDERQKVRKDDDKCLAYVKIDKPISRYSVEYDRGKRAFIPTVGTSSTQIIDMRNNEIAAEYNEIGYMGCGILGAGMFEFGLSARRYPKDTNRFEFVSNLFSAQ